MLKSFMKNSVFFYFLCIVFLCFGSCTSHEQIDYSTHVKPILNAKCIACHGGVKKQGGLSFLFEEEAFEQLESGKYAIVRGKPGKSEMIRRLTLEDEEERMPYKEEQLSKEEIDILTKWIEQGAKWGRHWAYDPVTKPSIPILEDAWVHTPIDKYILQGIQKQGLIPSPQADPNILARRLGLDLIGMPPPDGMADQYLQNPSEDNYEQLVDQLLASPHYGERWTSVWLDLARYADTKGYERDAHREIWRYRDWLIRAFNRDMPYDQFIIEQIAGDLLEDPSDDQYLATAFHRNTMTNDEGGTDNEEFRVAAVVDRVNTTWEALMSTSFACVQCHSHPYDPFTHEEYYKFYAFFNNTRDEDTYADYPRIRHFDSTQLASLEVLASWITEEKSVEDADKLVKFIKTLSPARNSLKTDSFVNSELADTKWLGMRNHSSARLPSVQLNGKNRLLFSYQTDVAGGRLTIRIDEVDGPVIGHYNLPQRLYPSWKVELIEIKKTEGVHDVYFTYENDALDDPNLRAVLFDWFHFMEALPGKDKSGYDLVEASFWELLEVQVPTTPIMVENPDELRRPSHLFERGSWLTLGQEVQPGTPASLHSFPENAPQNRLGLAQWIVSDQNPLTARTIVNRIWEQLFGTGLVETLEDMGTQGSNPLSQPLLDYMAWNFMHEQNWQLKKLLREIVLSATYRQSSKITEKHLELDPNNIYLARMPRVRLSAEQVRDQALVVCGALNDDLYGPPVMPHQPDGIWSSPYDGGSWKVSEGDQKYRRAVYTYWKRTSPYPSMITFDGVGREFCSSRRIRTNTPLQALATMNDEVFMDLSRKLTTNIWEDDHNQMIRKAYESVTQKEITQEKLQALEQLFLISRDTYEQDPKLTREICQDVVISDQSSFAAMVMVSNTILNLDEVITKT